MRHSSTRTDAATQLRTSIYVSILDTAPWVQQNDTHQNVTTLSTHRAARRVTMRRFVAIVLAAVVSAALPAVPAHAAVGTRPVRVMPLGDSITFGVGSSTGSSYRAALWDRLVGQAGYAVDYVGSQRSGALPDTDNEGHSGWRIDQIASNVDGWLATYQPDVVLL